MICNNVRSKEPVALQHSVAVVSALSWRAGAAAAVALPWWLCRGGSAMAGCTALPARRCWPGKGTLVLFHGAKTHAPNQQVLVRLVLGT